MAEGCFAPHRGTTAEGLRKGFAEGFAVPSGYVDHGYGYHGYTPWSTMLHHGYPKYPGCVCVGGREPLVFMVSEHKRRLRELYPSCLDQFEVDDRALDAQRDSC